MKPVVLSVFFYPLIIACTATEDMSVTQKHFLTACDSEYENSMVCEKLHNRKIKLSGNLYLPNNKTVAKLFPLGTIIPSHDDDALWDNLPADYDEIILRLNDTDSFGEFHQKNVEVTGIINTECVTGQRELSEEANRKNQLSTEDDEITISWLTGFCHYYSEYISNVKVSEIIK